MNEPKLCPLLLAALAVIHIHEHDGSLSGCLREKCAMWREAETIVQEQYIMVNRQVSPEIIRTDRYCGLAGKP